MAVAVVWKQFRRWFLKCLQYDMMEQLNVPWYCTFYEVTKMYLLGISVGPLALGFVCTKVPGMM